MELLQATGLTKDFGALRVLDHIDLRYDYGVGFWEGDCPGSSGGDLEQGGGQSGVFRGALMLQVEQIHAYYGGSHILHGLSLGVKAGVRG